MEGRDSIPTVDVCQRDFFVWKHTDVLKLRKNHRIIGVCAGSLPWKPRQNLQGGLPLHLSKVEAAFLVKSGITRLRDSNRVPQDAFTHEMKKQSEESRVAQRSAQTKLFQEQKAVELNAMSALILDAKQAKRQKLINQDSANKIVNEESFEKLKADEMKKTNSLRLEQTWIKMEILSKHKENFPIFEDYDFDLTECESLQLEVFSDLHNQGFFITNGNKFGGDFLVYPGDPIAYHSFYIVICVPHRRKLSGCELSAYGRLTNSVRKTLLLCTKTGDGEIKYLSMSWTGIVP